MNATVHREAATRDLIHQIGQGNQQAFEKLCRSYEKVLLRVAIGILGDREIAREIMQDVMVAIWEGAKTFRDDSKPFTWMWSIVRNKSLCALRCSAHSGAFELPRNYTFTQKPELDAIICEALETLSPEHRMVVILTYYLNFSQYRISQLMQCPVATVKSRLSTALKKLEKLWKVRFKGGRAPCEEQFHSLPELQQTC